MNKSSVSLVLIAVIWSAVVAALSMVLKGSPHSADATVLVTGGAVATVLLFGAAHRRIMRVK
jgi:hypothetical protein